MTEAEKREAETQLEEGFRLTWGELKRQAHAASRARVNQLPQPSSGQSGFDLDAEGSPLSCLALEAGDHSPLGHSPVNPCTTENGQTGSAGASLGAVGPVVSSVQLEGWPLLQNTGPTFSSEPDHSRNSLPTVITSLEWPNIVSGYTDARPEGSVLPGTNTAFAP